MEHNFVFINECDEDLSAYELKFQEIIHHTLNLLHIEDECELSCIVVGVDKIHEINREYRHIDRPTDVISFAYEDDEIFEIEGMTRELGDIFICLEKAKEQAKEYGHSFEREFCFLFTHGLLHLLGYDHMEEDEAQVMYALQHQILEALHITR